ncbi:MAG: ribonuclease H-like domain-containing protein [Eubacteriales bacterium]
MKVLDYALPDLTLDYPINQELPLEEFLFLDIETTGFAASTSNLYLIGAIYYRDNEFHLIQWFANTLDDEVVILKAFLEFSETFTHLVHFNGNQFDLPYLFEKCQQFQLGESFASKVGIDLYRRVLPYKKFLKLSNCKQKTIESFLNIYRTDTYDGGELITLYKEYLIAPSEYFLNKLLLHNAEDLLGLVQILPILSFTDLINHDNFVKKVQANSYKDVNGKIRQELLIYLTFPNKLPTPLSFGRKGCYFSASDQEGYLKVPMLQKELKYFYENYKDYYYLPAEDAAIHKTLAASVSTTNREQATAGTCYTRKEGTYLPQWTSLIKPFYKESIKSPELYFEITEELKRDRDFFTTYASHIMAQLVR